MMRLLTLVLVSCFSWPIYAQDEITQEQVEAKLKELEAEILQYRELLESTEGEKSDIEDTLERNEKGINDLLNKIKDIESELDVGEEKVSQLADEQKELLVAKAEQQYYIEQQVRAAYEIGNQEYLKVLLNQEDPNEIARMLTYYDYFNKARADQIEYYNETLDRLDAVTLALTEENQKLAMNRQVLEAQKNALTKTQNQKKQTLKALIEQIASTGTAL